MNPQYRKDFEQTQNLVKTSPVVGFSVLIDFCRKYGNYDLKLQAILISGKYNLLPEEARSGLQNEALAILQKIEKLAAAGNASDFESPLPDKEEINYKNLTRFHIQKSIEEDYVF